MQQFVCYCSVFEWLKYILYTYTCKNIAIYPLKQKKTAFIAYIPIITSQRKKCNSSQIILAK